MEVSNTAPVLKSPNHNTPRPAAAPKTTALHPVVMRLLAQRGWSADQLQDFFSWDLKELPELTGMRDMDKAAVRIVEAIERQEKIVVFGDYDVDGTTSCALLYHFFKMLNVEITVIQPSRFVEGYGIHPSNIERAAELDTRVLITVDCGITACEAADHALTKNIDLIITDHHKDAREEMPRAFAVINPNRRDEDDHPLKTLAGVGVAFGLGLAVRKEWLARGRQCPSLYPLLQFVAIGTICDLAHLSLVNLRLVRHGLKLIKTTEYPGIKTFFPPEDRALPIIPSEKLSFNVGPLINSKGRLDHPEKALEALTADTQEKANLAYSHLEISNRERKMIQAEVFGEARDMALEKMKKGEPAVTIVYAPHWHEGVIGIVASKLVETFRTPAVVFTNADHEGIIKASVRSAGDLNIFDCLNELAPMFERFGGHKAAAGLSMKLERLPEFEEKFQAIVAKHPPIVRTDQDYFDIDLAPSEITPDLLKQLELLEPYGMGNPRPVFRMSGIKLDSFDILKDVHVRWAISSPTGQTFKGISFNYIGRWGMMNPNELFSEQHKRDVDLTAYFELGINRWNGREYIQLQIDRITTEKL